MKKLRCALVGCGRVAPNHMTAAKGNKDVLELVAVCDLSEEKATNLLQKCTMDDGIVVYTDYKKLIGMEQPDFVVVATDSGSHAEIAKFALLSGCHVIIEKPMAMSLSDADELIEIAEQKGLNLAVSHQNRFNKTIRRIRKAVEEKEFGRLFYGVAAIRWMRNECYYSDGDWRGTWEKDGGCLMNQCIHDIDLLRWMMGDDIDEVFAYTDNLAHDYIEAEDMGLALIKFSNGTYGIVEGTTDVYPENLEETLTLFGQKGTVRAAGKALNCIDTWQFEGQTLEDLKKEMEIFEDIPNVYGFGHVPLYRDFAFSILEKRAPYVDGKAGRRAVELILAIYKSAAEGKPVKLPLKECTSTEFQGRFGR